MIVVFKSTYNDKDEHCWEILGLYTNIENMPKDVRDYPNMYRIETRLVDIDYVDFNMGIVNKF